MPYLMPYQINPQVAQRYAALHAASKHAAMQLEQGQAEQPLLTRIRALSPPMDQPSPLCVGIVPHSAADRRAALRWLLRDLQEADAAEAVTDRLIELRIAPLDHHIPQATSGTARNIAMLHVSGHPQIRELTVLLAPDLDGLLADIAMENQLRARSDLLLVAAPTHAEFSGAGMELLRDLVEAIPAWAPLITEGAGNAIWASEPGPGLRGVAFPPLQSHDSPPSLLGDPGDTVRRLLHLVGRGRPLQSLAHALVDGYQQRIREWQAIRPPPLPSGAPQALTEMPACKALKEQVKAATQEITAPQAPLLQLVGNDLDPLIKEVESALNKLGPGHLQREHRHDANDASRAVWQFFRRKFHLRLDDKFLSELSQTLRDSSDKECDAETEELVERVRTCLATIQAELNRLLGAEQIINSPPMNKAMIHKAIERAFNADFDHRFEMRENDIFAWMSYAKSSLTFIGIAAGLGSMSTIIKNLNNPQNNQNEEGALYFLVSLLAAAFVGLTLWGRIHFKHEEAEKLDLELERLRTKLKQHCKAIVADARTLKRESLNRWLRQCREQLLARINAVEADLLAAENQRRQADYQAALAEHAHRTDQYGRAQAQIAAHTPLLNALNTALTALAQHDERAALLQAATPAPAR